MGYVVSLVFDFQGIPVIPKSPARLTGYVNVRQEVHFNFLYPIALTCLAPPPLNIEAETSGLIPPGL